MNYRLVKRTLASGYISYVVEQQHIIGDIEGEWTSVFRSPDIDAAKEVLKNKRDRAVLSEEVLDE